MMNLIIKLNVNIKQAMKKITDEGEKCLVIIDKNKKLVGTLSDGDLRKAILKGYTIEDPIIDIYQKNPKSLIKDKYSQDEVENLFINHKYDLVTTYYSNSNERSFFRNLFTSVYTPFLNFLYGTDLPYFNGLTLYKTKHLKKHFSQECYVRCFALEPNQLIIVTLC